MSKHWVYGISLGLALAAATPPAQAQQDFSELCGTTLRIGLRDDAPPFAFRPDRYEGDSAQLCGAPGARDPLPDHAGYSVTLCRGFLQQVRRACGDNQPTIEEVPVSLRTRYRMLASPTPAFDLLCGATTATVTLRAELPASPYTFLTGSSALGGRGFRDGTGCRIGVIGGTTSDAGQGATDATERRLPGWGEFAARYPVCDPDALDADARKTYVNTAEAIADMLSANPSADLLIEDRHIVQWHLSNLNRLPGTLTLPEADTPTAFAALTPEEVRTIQRQLALLPDILTIEPYAMVAPRASARVMAHFSRYLTRLQGDQAYTDLLNGCFGRQVDRSFWFLVEFQSNVREGDFLPPPTGAPAPAATARPREPGRSAPNIPASQPKVSISKSPRKAKVSK